MLNHPGIPGENQLDLVILYFFLTFNVEIIVDSHTVNADSHTVVTAFLTMIFYIKTWKLTLIQLTSLRCCRFYMHSFARVHFILCNFITCIDSRDFHHSRGTEQCIMRIPVSPVTAMPWPSFPLCHCYTRFLGLGCRS